MLADLLAPYHGRPDVIVLGLARGGVPVAAEVAAGLGAPLDVFLVRKLGTPGQEELAMGAIASGGVRVLNRSVIGAMAIGDDDLERVTEVEQAELARRDRQYRRGRPPLDVAGRVVIVVDDGLATGSTMRAAVEALRQRNPSRVVVAVPVGAPATCEELATLADEVVCARQPDLFNAVGEWYRDFRPTTDAEIVGLLGSGTAGPAPSLLGFYERAVSLASRSLAGVRDDQLGAPTPCAGWDVRTLGNHLVAVTWAFAGMEEPDQDWMAGDRAAAFAEAAAASLVALGQSGDALPFALLDTVVHGWDLATATGQNPAIDADLAGAAFEVAKEVVTDQLRERGAFGPPVEVGDDAPVHERLVAFLGRRS